MHFEQGKSYKHVFVTFGMLWVALIILSDVMKWPVEQFKLISILLPSLLLFILVSELRSKVALDSWWVARYPAGDTMYTVLITWHIVGVIVLSALSVLLIVMW